MITVVLFLIDNYMVGLSGTGFIVNAEHMLFGLICEAFLEAPVLIHLIIKQETK